MESAEPPGHFNSAMTDAFGGSFRKTLRGMRGVERRIRMNEIEPRIRERNEMGQEWKRNETYVVNLKA